MENIWLYVIILICIALSACFSGSEIALNSANKVRLENQAKEMQKIVPNFNLQNELKNPAFLRMTSPNVGISVRDAYYAVHHDEMQTAAMQATAKATAQKISNNIQAGQRRPDENGISGQAPSATTFDYSKASPEQREAFKKDLRARLARGEKVYPGQR